MSRIEISKFPYFFYLFCSFSPLFSYRFLRSVRQSRPCVALCFYTFFDLYTPFFPNLPSICTVFCPVAKSIYQRFFNNFRRFYPLFADFIEKFTLCARLFFAVFSRILRWQAPKALYFLSEKGLFSSSVSSEIIAEIALDFAHFCPVFGCLCIRRILPFFDAILRNVLLCSNPSLKRLKRGISHLLTIIWSIYMPQC